MAGDCLTMQQIPSTASASPRISSSALRHRTCGLPLSSLGSAPSANRPSEGEKSVVSVRRLRKALVVAVLTIAMTVRAAYAAPAAAIAHLKAADCCARHCNHGTHPTRPDDCCRVLSQATDAALLTATPSAHHPGIGLPVSLQPTVGEALALLPVRERALDPPRRDAPIFLAIRSLRL